MKCRNCESENVATIVNGGKLAPFFLKRVHNMYNECLEEKLLREFYGKFLVDFLKLFKFSFNILNYRSSIKVPIRVCKNCHFIGPDYFYNFSMLSNLYIDYRSKSYNSDRIIFEPFYKNYINKVGKSDKEIISRLNNVDSLIEKYIDVSKIINVVDWGGGEGKFIPTSLQDKNVFILDISDEKPCDSKYKKIHQIPESILIDYVQICHVLEHVGSPNNLIENILHYVNIGGYIYIEVPQDKSDNDISEIISGSLKKIHGIHEHINLFSINSLNKLAEAFKLIIISLEVKKLDLGFGETTIISGLFKKI